LRAFLNSSWGRQRRFSPRTASETLLKAPILSPQLGLFQNRQNRSYLILLQDIIASFPHLKRPEKAQFFARSLFLYRPYAPDPLSWKTQPGPKPNARGAAALSNSQKSEHLNESR
jgi:hypothetical protein